MWKLYPWEWLIHESVAEPFRLSEEERYSRTRFWRTADGDKGELQQLYEPPWKLVMSSKAMLAYLWQKHPGHRNLLPAHTHAGRRRLGASAPETDHGSGSPGPSNHRYLYN